MKQLARASAALVLSLAVCVPAFAHGTNAHVRGVVTQLTAKSVTVQTADNTTKTLTFSAKTTFERSGKPAAMGDLKVGDRVVIDVPKNSSEALEVQIGTAPKTATK
jgi:hypothetical protein